MFYSRSLSGGRKALVVETDGSSGDPCTRQDCVVGVFVRDKQVRKYTDECPPPCVKIRLKGRERGEPWQQTAYNIGLRKSASVALIHKKNDKINLL